MLRDKIRSIVAYVGRALRGVGAVREGWKQGHAERGGAGVQSVSRAETRVYGDYQTDDGGFGGTVPVVRPSGPIAEPVMVRKNDGTMVPISEYMDSPEAWERPTVSEMKQAMALCAGLGFCEVCGQPIGCPPLIECPAAHNHVWDEPTEVETSQE